MTYNVIGEIDESFEWHAWNSNLARTNAAVSDLLMLLLKHSIPDRGRLDYHLGDVGDARMRVKKDIELVLIRTHSNTSTSLWTRKCFDVSVFVIFCCLCSIVILCCVM